METADATQIISRLLAILQEVYSSSQESEVWGQVLCPCPMTYALCPMSTSCY
ncbi:hypothetical protein [Microcoleus sp.]|uniref:hypothetical protein n=1 Tax=Microcoleus sp. TaxID=44472 RepID=UPI00403EA681